MILLTFTSVVREPAEVDFGRAGKRQAHRTPIPVRHVPLEAAVGGMQRTFEAVNSASQLPGGVFRKGTAGPPQRCRSQKDKSNGSVSSRQAASVLFHVPFNRGGGVPKTALEP